MRFVTIALLGICFGACGSAAGRLGSDVLGVTARDANIEASSQARTWDAGARLRYVEGFGVTAAGATLPGAGEWRFHYTSSRQTNALVVRVSSLEIGREERSPTSPPGFVIGNNALSDDWVDSSEAVRTALRARADAGSAAGTASLLLVPTVPEQWVVQFEGETRRWMVNARTGDLIRP